ncbi:uncharacterized protein LOC134541038 isoform X2 [Bacillus rossius redtenbacheri]
MSHAQMRSPYAPRPVGVVNVLPRFQDTGDDLPNRFGDETSSTSPPPLPPALSGANVDPVLASRVSEWPEERRPFWYHNAQAIRNSQQQSVNALPPPPPRSPFAANRNN